MDTASATFASYCLLFSGNEALSGGGLTRYDAASATSLINCTFSRNYGV